tara:strand:- start:4356 stop:4727 length:372 start_codon:yes stop_codon:yes gene_type:complete
MIYSFTVKCDNSNPVPYKRTTQRQKFVDKEYKKYVVWKNKVVAKFILEFTKYPHNLLEKDKKYYVDVVAYYKDKKHADTDNVAKGINDAIFQKPLNDKYVAGSYDFSYDKENPRVEITIKEDK